MTNCHTAGSVYRSKPYRFAIRNGDFVMVETEWSSFLNPWSRRLEFITGLHQVLQVRSESRKIENFSISRNNKIAGPHQLRQF